MIPFNEIDPRRPGLLLVDADPWLRQGLAAAMERLGWLVWTAADGATAIRLFKENPGRIDAAVVDLQLPGLQGRRVLAELGTVQPGLVLAAMSVNVHEYSVSAFRRLSATPLFLKPLSAEALSSALQDILSGQLDHDEHWSETEQETGIKKRNTVS
jgi:DNA-binding response OmpR family regulator